VSTYENRNDAFSFEKLSKIIVPEERIDFFVSHFIEKPKMWIREMTKNHYENYKASIRLFPETFENDMQLIASYNPRELMEVKNDIPQIHKLYLDKKISVETIITMNHFYSFIDKHQQQVKVPFVWPEYISMVQNYRPFFEKRINDIHKDIMKTALSE
jgi:hypothetical protein